MINPVTVILSFALFLLVLALLRPQAGRIVFGIFFLIMAWGINFPILLSDPGLFVKAGEQALIPFYRWFFTHIIAWNPSLLSSLLILFETSVGVLVLSKGRWVKAGLGLGALFCLGIAWVGVEGLMMPAVAIAPIVLARQNFTTSLIDLIYSRFRKQKTGRDAITKAA